MKKTVKKIKSKSTSKKNNSKKNGSIFSFLEISHPTSKIPTTLGQRAADLLSKWAGSWTFIIIFGAVLLSWIILNTTRAIFGVWDEPPFILLNLLLSFVAAFQAPVILMSQNRQTQRDRVQAKYDYSVNRKAVREIQEVKKQLNRIEKKLNKK